MINVDLYGWPQVVPNDPQLLFSATTIINKCMADLGLEPIVVIDGVLPRECYIMTSMIFDLENDIQFVHIEKAYEFLKSKLQSLGLTIYKEIVPFN